MFPRGGKRMSLNTQWPKRTGVKKPTFTECDFPSLGAPHVIKTNSCAVWGTAVTKTIIGSKKKETSFILQTNTESREQYYKRLKTIYDTPPGDLYTFELTSNHVITRVVARNMWIARFIMQKKNLPRLTKKPLVKKTRTPREGMVLKNCMYGDGVSDNEFCDDSEDFDDDGIYENDNDKKSNAKDDTNVYIWLDPKKTCCTKTDASVRIRKERILYLPNIEIR
jgi:hypothetical protein